MERSLASSSWPIRRFLKSLASRQPTPGGGSAAALAAAFGAGLGIKVGGIVYARPKTDRSSRGRTRRAVKGLNGLLGTLEHLIQEDAQAYSQMVSAHRSGRNLPAATRRATRAPMKICQAAAHATVLLKDLRPAAGKSLRSDLSAGVSLLRGAFEAARAMVEINLKGVPSSWAKKIRQDLREWKKKLQKG